VPELPEVETVRLGLALGVAGRTIERVEVSHPRAVRRHEAGGGDFADQLAGHTVLSAQRRGKYLWLPLDGPDALVAHLGMSGQLLVVPPDKPLEKHLRVRFVFADGVQLADEPAGRELRFVDQRTFGGLFLSPAGLRQEDPPTALAHIAPDPLEPAFDDAAFIAAVRGRRTGIKRALLDQTVVSGIGNIYADEALWRARLHYARPTETLTRPALTALLGYVRDVLSAAITAGGTSFDALYVSVNGVSGLFDRSLEVYGREGEPCSRCGQLIRREPFMNRSSFRCPRCQPQPRVPRW
jgi:formamidopyrimidine-DNA glycosylase